MDAVLRQFFATYRDVDLIEAVVDTSVDGPCLNLWALRIQDGGRLEDAMAQVEATRDWGFLADITDEAGSSTFEISLATVYPDWPDAIGTGDQALAGMLEAAAAGLPAGMHVLFHHVDAWPAMNLGRARDRA